MGWQLAYTQVKPFWAASLQQDQTGGIYAKAAMRAVTFPHHLHVCHRPECLCKVRTQLRLILVGCTTNEDLRVNADESVLAHMLAD